METTPLLALSQDLSLCSLFFRVLVTKGVGHSLEVPLDFTFYGEL